MEPCGNPQHYQGDQAEDAQRVHDAVAISPEWTARAMSLAVAGLSRKAKKPHA
jgi:hypothetical protein